jgi:hypothetical protein
MQFSCREAGVKGIPNKKFPLATGAPIFGKESFKAAITVDNSYQYEGFDLPDSCASVPREGCSQLDGYSRRRGQY